MVEDGAMVKKIKLDLKGVISPLDLLKSKARLSTMKPGQILEVILGDREVAEQLATIIRRSGDELINIKEGQNQICLCIRKGTGEKT